jgi:hypothetical protein
MSDVWAELVTACRDYVHAHPGDKPIAKLTWKARMAEFFTADTVVSMADEIEQLRVENARLKAEMQHERIVWKPAPKVNP